MKIDRAGVHARRKPKSGAQPGEVPRVLGLLIRKKALKFFIQGIAKFQYCKETRVTQSIIAQTFC